ncbi:meiosis initiator protein isoform X3 [Narcine bancroftii]|uniref:meiosis initiator protein isoform X3 n=1 Tax=Narcine bancroftii TaxID=1343680 RepID=UPI003831486C
MDNGAGPCPLTTDHLHPPPRLGPSIESLNERNKGMLLRIMSSLIQVKHEVNDWNFEQNIEIPSMRDILTLNYREPLTPDNQKIKLSPLQHRRRQREQYRSNVNSLRDLAAVLPVPPQKPEKHLTKKEVLNQVLRYIAFLKRHISNTKSLLKNHSVEIDEIECCLNGEKYPNPEEAGQNNAEEISRPSLSPTFKKMRLRNICPKPSKKKWVEKAEWRQMLKSYRCLYNEPVYSDIYPQSNIQHEIDQMWQGTPLDISSSSSCSQDSTDRLQGHTLYVTLLEVADSRNLEESSLGNLAGTHEMYNGTNDERRMNFSHDSSLYDSQVSPPYPSLKDQKLVHYLSSHDEDDEVDRSPWLPQGSPQGAAEVHSPVTDSLTTSGLQASLGLSPSLLSSPGRHFQLLQEGKENLTQALFGSVCLSPEFPMTKPGDVKRSNTCQIQQSPNGNWNAPLKDDPDQTVPETPPVNSFQSTFIFDHCYVPCSGTSRSESSQADSTSSGENSCQICPSSEKWDRCLLQEDSNEMEHWLSSSEDNDITWTPYCRGKLPPQAALSKLKRIKGISQGKHPGMRRKRCYTLQLKKKCVNGFIMFCRVNRRLYISDHPGTASTAATKALAQVWHTMSKNERRPYWKNVEAVKRNDIHIFPPNRLH